MDLQNERCCSDCRCKETTATSSESVYSDPRVVEALDKLIESLDRSLDSQNKSLWGKLKETLKSK